MVGLVFMLMLSILNPQHKFYLSVTEIRYAQEEESLQIAIKLFTDDLEQALTNQFKQEIRLSQNNLSQADLKRIGAYLIEHFEIKVNGKIVQADYLGSENQLDATWNYIEIKHIRRINKLEITNSLLLSEFDEQVNILNFIYQNKTRSFIGNKENYVFELTL